MAAPATDNAIVPQRAGTTPRRLTDYRALCNVPAWVTDGEVKRLMREWPMTWKPRHPEITIPAVAKAVHDNPDKGITWLAAELGMDPRTVKNAAAIARFERRVHREPVEGWWPVVITQWIAHLKDFAAGPVSLDSFRSGGLLKTNARRITRSDVYTERELESGVETPSKPSVCGCGNLLAPSRFKPRLFCSDACEHKARRQRTRAQRDKPVARATVEQAVVASEVPVLPRQSPSPATTPMNYETLTLRVLGTGKWPNKIGLYAVLGVTPDGHLYSWFDVPQRKGKFIRVTGSFYQKDGEIVRLNVPGVAVAAPEIVDDYTGRAGPGQVLFGDLPEHHPWHDGEVDYEVVNAHQKASGKVLNEGALSAEQFEKVRVATAAINDGTWSDLRDVAQVELSDEEKEWNKGEALAAAIKVVPLDVSSDKYNEYATKTIAKFIANQYSRADAEAEVMPYSEWCEIQERNHALIAKAAA